jgi:UDP-glucose 4-epimerase
MDRVLITGGFGYIGGRLAQHLVRVAHKRVVLGTRRSIPPPDWLASGAVVETPWQSPAELRRLCEGFDAVVHAAGMNAQDCAADPVGALEFNGVATARLVQAAVAAGVKRIIYVSTAHVYCSPLRGSITEHNLLEYLHPYPTSHRAGETAVALMHERGAIEGIVIRVSNSFGAPAHQGANCWMLLVNDLCRQAVTTRKMTLSSSGMQRRDFVTLTDVCRAIAYLLNIEVHRLGDGLYNVGGAWTPTIIEMAERIATNCQRVFGYTPQITRPQVQVEDASEALEYRIDKLLATGFNLTGDVDLEITGALEFCSSLNGAQPPR